MVEFFISWHAALVFLAALASPGWGAATAGLFIGIEADSWTLRFGLQWVVVCVMQHFTLGRLPDTGH